MYMIYLTHAGNVQDRGRVYAWPPTLHAGNVPDIPPIPCIGWTCHQPYTSIGTGSVQEILPYTATGHAVEILNYPAQGSVLVHAGIIYTASGHVIEIFNYPVQMPSICRKFDLSFANTGAGHVAICDHWSLVREIIRLCYCNEIDFSNTPTGAMP